MPSTAGMPLVPYEDVAMDSLLDFMDLTHFLNRRRAATSHGSSNPWPETWDPEAAAMGQLQNRLYERHTT